MLAEPPFSFLDILDLVDDAIDANAEIADEILASGLEAFGIPTESLANAKDAWQGCATPNDMSKAHSTLRQFFRDWSAAGASERVACYAPVLEALFTEYPPRGPQGRGRVLIPGAGLGRLVFEICRAGFCAEGNEISYHQLLASSWILNHSEGQEMHTLFPFASQFSNVVSRKDQLQKILVPDVHPGTAMAEAAAIGSSQGKAVGEMNMTAADFVSLYSRQDYKTAFDAVVTVFFIDTAPNVLRYVETILACLKPGGVWINLGPLLWHFDDRGQRANEDQSEAGNASQGATGQAGNKRLGIAEPGSVELSEEEVLLLIQRSGFDVEKHEIRSQGAGYIQDPKSMLQNTFRMSHWLARKRR